MSEATNHNQPGRPLRLDYIQAGTLTTNPKNWRRHPDGQKSALKEVLDDPDVGWAGALLFNERTGRLIDGHGRLEVTDPELYVPVLVGSWSEEAEKKILLTLDPIAAMATADVSQLAELLSEVELETPGMEELAKSLNRLLPNDGIDASYQPEAVAPGDPRYMVVITCQSESHQADLLDKLMSEGLKVKALVG